jgi:hypothetical protein
MGELLIAGAIIFVFLATGIGIGIWIGRNL